MARGTHAAKRRRIHGRSRPVDKSSHTPCHAGANHTWVKIGTIWRQEQEPCADRLQGLRRGGGLVAREVVENDDIARAQRRHQLGLDVEREHLGVHGAVDHPWRVQPVVAQRCDEGLGAPMAKGRVIDQALPARGPTCGFGHVGLHRGFVNEREPFEMAGHERLAFGDPDVAQISDILALLLKRLKVFFLCVRPSWRSIRQTVPRCILMPWVSASSAVNSSSVISPLAATRASIQPVTPASLPWPPPLPCGRGDSDPS